MTDFDDHFYRPPMQTTASLMFPARSQQTVRGFIHAKTPADGRWRQVTYASQGERETALLLLAERQLWNIHDQPPPVPYRDIDGRQRTHRFDYLATFMCGQAIAVAVKPEKQVLRLRFRETLACIRRDLTPHFAQKIVLVTERQRHPLEVQNAERLNLFRRIEDQAADKIMQDAIAAVQDEVCISHILSQTNLEGRGFRAIFRAIYDGQLHADKQKLITPQSRVVPVKEIET